MTHYHIAVLDPTKSYAKMMAKKTQETDYTIYNHKEGEQVLCLYEPHAYPDKIQSLLHTLHSADSVLWVIDKVDADFAEMALALWQLDKPGWIIYKDIDANDIKPMLGKSPMAAWPVLDADLNPAQLREKLMSKPPPRPETPTIVMVDACFEVRGVGTVVLGKLESGQVAVHDELQAVPGKMRTGVRSIQVQDEDIQKAELGSRVGLGLKGTSADAIKRGSYLVTPGSMSGFEGGKMEVGVSPLVKEGLEPNCELFFSYGLQFISLKLDNKEAIKAGTGTTPGAGGAALVGFKLLTAAAAPAGGRVLLVRTNKKPRIIGYGVLKN